MARERPSLFLLHLHKTSPLDLSPPSPQPRASRDKQGTGRSLESPSSAVLQHHLLQRPMPIHMCLRGSVFPSWDHEHPQDGSVDPRHAGGHRELHQPTLPPPCHRTRSSTALYAARPARSVALGMGLVVDMH